MAPTVGTLSLSSFPTHLANTLVDTVDPSAEPTCHANVRRHPEGLVVAAVVEAMIGTERSHV
jgi:hypothetical protein